MVEAETDEMSDWSRGLRRREGVGVWLDERAKEE
jgi:hypothetical protein